MQENADELMKIEDVNVAFYKTGLLNVLNAMWVNILNYYYLKEKRTIEIPPDKIISVNKRVYELKENLEISVNIIRYITAINTETCAIKVKCLPIRTSYKKNKGKIKMIMLYANYIKGSAINYDRLIIKKDDIIKVTKQYENIVLNIKYDYAVELKENKNFTTISEFFDYIRDYSEICFETKEVPTKSKIKVGDIYCAKTDLYYVVLAIRYNIENINNKKFDLLRIYKENLVGIERNESISFFEDMNYIGNSLISINCIISSIESIMCLTK